MQAFTYKRVLFAIAVSGASAFYAPFVRAQTLDQCIVNFGCHADDVNQCVKYRCPSNSVNPQHFYTDCLHNCEAQNADCIRGATKYCKSFGYHN
jgi:hypothetical protein